MPQAFEPTERQLLVLQAPCRYCSAQLAVQLLLDMRCKLVPTRPVAGTLSHCADERFQYY